MTTFPARYPGRCPSCDERIHEGDLLTWADDKAVHADCDSAAPAEKPADICPKCYMARAVSGVCGCEEDA